MMKKKKIISAIPPAVSESPEKPRAPASKEMTKKIITQVSIASPKVYFNILNIGYFVVLLWIIFCIYPLSFKPRLCCRQRYRSDDTNLYAALLIFASALSQLEMLWVYSMYMQIM